MVTSYMMNENEMGYRGSKSVLSIKTVKEQRVDGSRVNFKNLKLPLRCTLMGGESRYPVKIPSNQIINKHYYCSNFKSNSNLAITPLNPYFVTGFSDGEASFIILILKEPKNKTN
jgi:hypothetical protein